MSDLPVDTAAPAPVDEILSSVPASAGALAPAAAALGTPVHEGMLGDPQVNGEHVVAHVGLQDLLEGKLSDKIIREADRADDPAAAGVAGLGAVEDAVNKHADAIDAHAKDALTGSARKADVPKALDSDAHGELVTRLNNLANNPQALIDRLSQATLALHAVAPQTAQSAQQTATRAVQFLAGKAPQGDPDPLGDAYEPSTTEIANFNRYLSVVEDPKSALRQVKDGTLTPETVETLATVYPRLYDRMKQSILTNLDASVPYQRKMSVSQFLGEPLDSSLSPARIASLQTAMVPAAKPAGPEPGAKSPRRSLSKLDVASRTSLAPKDDG